MAMEEGIRVRIGFVDRNILNKSQKLEGLKRCWLLLPREIDSISALASLIIHKFSLQDACPYGLLLFMDDFVLPPFESTCILKDNDIIRVKRKGGKLISYDTNHIEDSETMEKWPLLTGAKLLATQGPEKDTHTEHEEDFEGVSHLENSSCGNTSMKKKRKRVDNLHSSKVKKKGAKLIGYGANHIEDSETMEKQSLLTGAKLLATQGPEKDTRTEYEEDFEGALHLENSSCGGNMSTKKKRKHAENLYSSKVNGKGAKLISYGANHIEDPETMEKQSLCTGAKLLVTQGPEKDTLTEDDEAFEGAVHLENSCGNMSTKKRKHADNLHSSKRKKARSIGTEKHLMASNDGVEKSVQAREKDGIHCDGDISQKSHTKKDKQSNVKSRSDVIASPGISNEVENVEPMPIEEGGDRLPVNSQNRVDTSHILDGTEKFPSRSARRKKAKRKWLRELAEFQKKELIQKQTLENDIHKKSPEHQQSNESAGLAVSQKKEIIQKKMLEKDMHKKLPEHQQPNQNTDTDDEVVPVVIKPGHIRFEPLDKDAEQRNWELNDPVETFQWTGTTSKKKGQKWGLERTSVCRRNDDKGSDVNSVGKPDIEEGELVDAPVDFEKLLPLSGSPKEGDIIVYRMLELSSSWCPELSSFRVGKISSYDPSGKVILLPVKEYPVLDENKDEETAELLSGASLYNADGSLEIDFASLVDVRILNHNKEDRNKEEPMTVVMNGSNEPPASSQPQEPGVSNGSKPNAEVAPSPIKENEGQMTAWDDIDKALSEKKEQLLQKNGGGTQETSAKRGWSSRAMRSSALGPTMALLREKNQL